LSTDGDIRIILKNFLENSDQDSFRMANVGSSSYLAQI